jgi:hypothetical protein
MLVEPTQIWTDSERNEFTVLHVVSDRAGHVWIHYRDSKGQEYSCYQESFLERFTILSNRK